MSRPLWVVQVLKKLFPSRVFVAKATRVPVIGKFVDHWLFEGDDMLYLPRTKVLPVGESVENPGEIVLPSQVAEHFVETAEYHFVMDKCLCRDAAGCKDYPIDLGCLFLGEAASQINPQLGRRVTKKEALAHLQACHEAGLVHTIGRNKLDSVWLGVAPRQKLMTICNCCPCCCLWGVLPYMPAEIGDKVTRMPGVQVTVTERCTGCGICTQGSCVVDAIHLNGGRAVISDACRGCGRCVDICPQQAIEISVDNGQVVAESIDRLSALVDLS